MYTETLANYHKISLEQERDILIWKEQLNNKKHKKCHCFWNICERPISIYGNEVSEPKCAKKSKKVPKKKINISYSIKWYIYFKGQIGVYPWFWGFLVVLAQANRDKQKPDNL